MLLGLGELHLLFFFKFFLASALVLLIINLAFFFRVLHISLED